MLMKILLTLGSRQIISKAFLTVSGVAPLFLKNELTFLIACVPEHSPSNVQEVSRVTTVERQDIHSGHGKTGTINEAANVTVQLDEVEVSLLCFYLRRVFLGDIPQTEYIGLTELRIIVEPELSIHTRN